MPTSPLTPLVALFLAALAPLGAAAQSHVDDLVRIEVLDGGRTASGGYQTALRLHLSEGWKTYWRAPGEAGIPPQFDWRGSENVGGVAISWPTPVVFDQSGMRSIGYHDQLVLPIEITPARPDAPVRLRGQVEIGLCKDVCIPGTLDFDHRLDGAADRHPAIAAALAQRPYSEAEAGLRSATCRVTPSGDGMRIEAHLTMPSAGGREVAVIEPGSSTIWASETETTRRGEVLIAASDLVSVTGGAFALDRSMVRITVLGENHAVDIHGCTPG